MPNANGTGFVLNLNYGNDNFTADAARAIAIAADYPDLVWSGILALTGDDIIIRDRTGGYAIGGTPGFPTMSINGGAGFDIIKYSLANSGLTADLRSGSGHIENTGGNTFKKDIYTDIEGLFGTHYDDDISGNDFGNQFNGLNGSDTLDGRGGNDTIYGGNGADRLLGGNGADVLFGGAGGDLIWGGKGNDFLIGEGGADMIDAGAGRDTVLGGSGADTIYGEEGNDSINGGGDADLIKGGDGNDTIDGAGGADTTYGGNGNDRIYVNGGDTAYGEAGRDTFYVSTGSGDNVISGGNGLDRVIYSGDADVIVYLYDQRAERGSWDDVLTSIRDVHTGGGDDLVFGSSETNTLRTGDGADAIYTVGGNDFVDAGSGNDVIVGYGGSETLLGGLGNDLIDGGAGNDTIRGGTGMDTLRGGDGNDVMTGASGNDTIGGGGGDDTINGGFGNDEIRGGTGYDEMSGGLGVDTFVWRDTDYNGAIDVIWDFNGTQDKLGFGADFFELNAMGATPIGDVLKAYAGWGGTIIEARTADDGWTAIAVVQNAGQTAAIQQRIADGSILDVAVNGGFAGGPGGLAGAGAGLNVLEPGANDLLF